MKMRVPILFLLLIVGVAAVWLVESSRKKPDAIRKPTQWSRQLDQMNELACYKHTTTARYHAYATAAREQQREDAARLFDALARSELVHEINCADAVRRLGGTYHPPQKIVVFMGDTTTDLISILDEETANYDRYRRGMIEHATKQGNRYAARIVIRIAGGEMRQIQLIDEFIQGCYTGGYAVCPACGNMCRQDRCDHYCPFCQTAEHAFMHFD